MLCLAECVCHVCECTFARSEMKSSEFWCWNVVNALVLVLKTKENVPVGDLFFIAGYEWDSHAEAILTQTFPKRIQNAT